MKRTTPKARHPLCLTSHDLFGLPMGDDLNTEDIEEDQYREWQHQNAELFLRRLSHWKRLGKTRAATDALRAARTPDAIDEVWMRLRPMTAAGRATGGR